jgi:glutathione peroxidase
MFAKVDVKGPKAHPLWVFLCSVQTGVLGTTQIKWNFTKFLCDREGKPVRRYGTQTSPFGIEEDIVALLKE